MVVASVLILVLCIIKVKKLKVDARKSGMHKCTVLKSFIYITVSWCDVHCLVKCNVIRCRDEHNKYKCMNTLTLRIYYKMKMA